MISDLFKTRTPCLYDMRNLLKKMLCILPNYILKGGNEVWMVLKEKFERGPFSATFKRKDNGMEEQATVLRVIRGENDEHTIKLVAPPPAGLTPTEGTVHMY